MPEILTDAGAGVPAGAPAAAARVTGSLTLVPDVPAHLGNLHPDEIAADPVYAKVIAEEDATQVSREFGRRVDTEADVPPDTERWRTARYRRS